MNMGRFISLRLLACVVIFILHYKVVYSSSSSSLYTNFSPNTARWFCSHEESSALLQFKRAFIINSVASSDCDDLHCDYDYYGVYSRCNPTIKSFPKTKYWKVGSDCCSWEGVSCDEISGHVIELDLSCSQLQGVIHSNSSLFQLLHLRRLNLAFNNFSGSQISSKFSQFVYLTHLNTSLSEFSGEIPSEISNLSKLVSLDLSIFTLLPDRRYAYQIEKVHLNGFDILLHHLTKLQKLVLDGIDVSFSSSVASKSYMARNLSSSPFSYSLTYLSLRHCLLPKLPKDIFHWQYLRRLDTLDLFYANLSGELPDSIIFLESLKYLDLTFCRLERFPKGVGNLTKLSHLSLADNEFSGQVSLTIFSNLEQLEFLDLSWNEFEGQLPNSFANLKKLKVVRLDRNNFTGGFPYSFANLSLLNYLSISGNHLGGHIPANITGFQLISEMDLSYNSFNGEIPSWLFQRPSLVTLNLGKNQLTGEIFPHTGEFKSNSLQYIDLSSNNLQGADFSFTSNLVNLTRLDLSSNNLTGTLGWDVLLGLRKLKLVDVSNNSHISLQFRDKFDFPLSELIELLMSSCNVSAFPFFLKNLVHLELLDLSNNKIHGPLPEWLGIMGKSSLKYLLLSHNFLTSSVEILPWGNLTYLDLSFNLLEGTLPVPASTTENYLISNNKINGKIHPRICDLSVLELVDFSNNSLSGTIPNCLSNITSLEVLDLRHNNLSGTIPEMVGDKLIILDLSHNQLEGQLPRSLANCTELELLDLSYNFIFDTFPSWLETLPWLKVLKLRSNRFYGSIANSRNASSFPKLHIIDLSFNKLLGNLPSHYFRSWKSMMMASDDSNSSSLGGNYYSVILTNKGQEMELVARLIILVKAIDFSNNKFEGKIPESIGNLKSLIVLNLSSNGLTGEIPTSLENLVQLESLDLSNNKLSGRIPQQLNSLTFLGAFNVSQNNLEGPIPQTGQLSTFPYDSYEDNPGLCGIQVSKKCESVVVPHPPISSSEEDQNADTILDGFNWKSVAIGYGCGTIIGMIIGHIIIKRNEEWVLSLFNIRLLWRIKKPN